MKTLSRVPIRGELQNCGPGCLLDQINKRKSKESILSTFSSEIFQIVQIGLYEFNSFYISSFFVKCFKLCLLDSKKSKTLVFFYSFLSTP